MKFFFACLLAMLSFSKAASQKSINDSCDCNKDYAFVVNYLENHYSGFADNITNNNRQAYEDFKKLLSEKSKEQQTTLQCIVMLKEFLNFFRDRHLQIYFGNNATNNSVNEKSEEEVQKFKASQFFQRSERISYDSAKIWSHLSQSSDSLEGVYENDVYQIAVLKNKTGWREYYGIITQSKTSLWEKGQVKMEFNRISPVAFETIFYSRNHAVSVGVTELANPILVMMADLKKIYPLKEVRETKLNTINQSPGNWFQFKELNDSTCYIRIRTFEGSLKSKFDSAYKKAFKIISQKPNLLVDIRNNGGGSDNCWHELIKYLYTQPIKEDAMEIYCSSETIKRYEEWLANMKKNRKGYGWQTIKFMKVKIRKMKKAKPGSFLPFKEVIPGYARPFINFDTYKQRKVYAMPKKVIVMYNRNTGSAAEGLIISAMQSKKVLTFGENSGGFITFGNVTTVNTPSGFVLQSGTHHVPNRFKYEKVGIPPQVRATNTQDWIEQSNQLWKLIK